MPTRLLRLLLWLVPAALLQPTGALAQGPTPMADWQYSAGVVLIPYFVEKMPIWQGIVVAGAVTIPEYEGAREHRQLPVLAAELRYKNLAYVSSSEGAGFNVLQGKSFRIGTSVGVDFGRFETSDERLTGLGDIESAPELRFYAEKVLFPFVLRGAVRHTLDGGTGWLTDLAAYLPVAGGKKYFVLAGPSVTFADRQAMQRRFGVTPQQAARSAFPEYDADGGLRNAAVGVVANYFFDQHWFANVTGSAQKFLSSAAESPIAERDLQLGLIVLAGYRW